MCDWKSYERDRLVLPGVEEPLDNEIIEEVACQLEDCYLEALSGGASEEEAKARAEAHVADWESLAADIRRSKRSAVVPRIDRRAEEAEVFLRGKGGRWAAGANLMQELRFSLRRMRATSGLTFVILLTLAVGIGANTAIFSVVNGILLKPLPYDEPDQLVSIWASAPAMGEEQLPMSPAVNFTIEDESPLLESIGIWSTGSVTILGEDEPRRVQTVTVTAGVLPALRVQPVLGRYFTVEDDTPGTPRTILISHAYWQSRYGGNSGVIGQALTINDVPREIIGVMPAEFRFFSNDPVIYFPARFNRASLFVGNFSYPCIARVKDGVDLEDLRSDLMRLLPIAVERYPGGMTMEILEQAQADFVIHSLRDDIVGDVGNVLWVLLGSVGIILLIACANVANLFLVSAEIRERELAVRSALGATRGQITGQFLLESVVMGVLGGAFGLGLAYAGLHLLLTSVQTDLPRVEEITVDPTVLLFTVAVSLFAGLLFGILPVFRYGRMNLAGALKEGGRWAADGKDKHRARSGLVIAQVALALVLLVGSGLMIRSFQTLRRVDPGFKAPEELLAARLTIPGTEIPDDQDAAAAFEQIARRLEEVSGVTSVGLSTSITMDGAGGYDPIWVEDHPVSDGQMPPIRRFKWTGPGYHATMQNPVIAGRTFTWDDVHNRAEVVVVTENFAREYWDDPADAVGKRIGTGQAPGEWFEILGVVGNVRDDGVTQPPTPVVYWPMALARFWPEMRGDEPFIPRTHTFVIRSSRVGTPDFLPDIRAAVSSVNPNLPFSTVRTMSDLLRGSMARTSLTLVLLAIAASVALLLGTIGIYGVISYAVSQRTRELGVRIALGAGGREVVQMVLRQGLVLAGVGVAIGLVSAYGLTRLMSALLYGVSPTDPLTYAVVAVVLVGVAMLASYLPARRAASVDPIEALRAE
jgi:predicted permease